MSRNLSADVQRLNSNRHQIMFHRWKALTANIISTTVPQEDRDEKGAEIMKKLDAILDGLYASWADRTHRREILAIVGKAGTWRCGSAGSKGGTPFDGFPKGAVTPDWITKPWCAGLGAPSLSE
ncbi:hypothetical protein ACHAPT_006481 [Fusarium lateritium]